MFDGMLTIALPDLDCSACTCACAEWCGCEHCSAWRNDLRQMEVMSSVEDCDRALLG